MAFTISFSRTLLMTAQWHRVALVLTGLLGTASAINAHEVQTDGMVRGGSPIGAPFELQSSRGQMLNHMTFRGKWLIVFFGYTSCPDICPTTLSTLTEMFSRLDVDAGRVTGLFITLDPGRDSPELLSAYMTHFSPRIVAATGTDSQISAATKAFRVRYEIEGEKSTGHYTISHPVAMMLFDTKGQFATLIPGGVTAAELVKTVRSFMQKNR